jgi:hypothetical protein
MSLAMASVSWISPPAPAGLVGQEAEDFGCRM